MNTARINSLEKFSHMTISDYSLYTQEVLEASINRQMNNDKNLGLQLSGGVKDFYFCKWVLKDIAAKFFGNEFAYRKKMRMRLPIGKYILDDKFKNYINDIIRPGIKKRFCHFFYG